jgi:hypothetical protein
MFLEMMIFGANMNMSVNMFCQETFLFKVTIDATVIDSFATIAKEKQHAGWHKGKFSVYISKGITKSTEYAGIGWVMWSNNSP